VLEADREIGNKAITVTTGAEFDGAIPKRGEIRLVGQAPFEPLRRFLRFGPDWATNLKPFEDILAAYPGAMNPPLSAIQPESPSLTASAGARFAGLERKPAPEAVPKAPAPAVDPLIIGLAAAEADAVVWSCAIGPDEAGQIWSGARAVVLHCGIAAVDAALLAPVLARLGAHSVGFTLHAKDVASWRASLGALCASKALPGPDLDIRCPVAEWQPAAASGPAVKIAAPVLAATIQSRLDREVLRQLHVVPYDILGTSPGRLRAAGSRQGAGDERPIVATALPGGAW
jgi:hypothetical protein